MDLAEQKETNRRRSLDLVAKPRSALSLADTIAAAQLQEALEYAVQSPGHTRTHGSSDVSAEPDHTEAVIPSRQKFHKQDLIEATSMFFNRLLDPAVVPAPVYGLLVHLQLPVLRAVLLNERFFFDSRHPARRLIKLLYVKAKVLGEHKLYEQDQRYLKMLSAVKDVAAEFSGDERLFLKAYFEVNQIQVET